MSERIIIFIALFGILGWEFLRPRLPYETLELRKAGNVSIWVVNYLMIGWLFGSEWFEGIAQEVGANFAPWPIENAILGFILGFIFLDLLRYLTHRGQHLLPLWWFHKVHHADVHLDVTTTLRQHPLDYLVGSLAYAVAFFIFDVPIIVITTYGLAEFCWSTLQHGNINLPSPIERWSKMMLMTTNLHRVHHSTDYRESNSNFGPILSWWDRIFGTLREATPENFGLN